MISGLRSHYMRVAALVRSAVAVTADLTSRLLLDRVPKYISKTMQDFLQKI